MFHTRTHIDLNKPRIIVLIDHKIIPNHLTSALPPTHTSLTSPYTPHNNIIQPISEDLPSIPSNILNKIVNFPHTLFNIALFVVLLDTVVGEVDVTIVDVIERKIICAETDVTILVHPDFGRAEILDQHPNADVELFALDEERIFDVLLDYELPCSSQTIIYYIVEVIVAPDSSPSRHNYIIESTYSWVLRSRHFGNHSSRSGGRSH